MKRYPYFVLFLLLIFNSCKDEKETAQQPYIVLEGTASSSRFYNDSSFFNIDTVKKTFQENGLDFWLFVQQQQDNFSVYPQKLLKTIRGITKKLDDDQNFLFIEMPEFSASSLNFEEENVSFYVPAIKELPNQPISPIIRELGANVSFHTAVTDFEGKITSYFDAYLHYLNQGFFLGASLSSEILGPDWNINNTPRLSVMVRQKNKEELKAAIQKRHTYVSFERGTLMDFRINDAVIGDIIHAEIDKKQFYYQIKTSHPSVKIGKIELITNNGRVLKSFTEESNHFEKNGTLELEGAFQYVILKVYFENGNVAYTSPIWILKEKKILLHTIKAKIDNPAVQNKGKKISYQIENLTPSTISNIDILFSDPNGTVLLNEKLDLKGRESRRRNHVLELDNVNSTELSIQSYIHDKLYTNDSITIPGENIKRVLFDASHNNLYIESMGILKKALEAKGMVVSFAGESSYFLKDSILQNHDLIIITPPQSINNSANSEINFNYAIHRFVYRGGAVIVIGDGSSKTKTRVSTTYLNRLLKVLYSPIRFRYTEKIGTYEIFDETSHFLQKEYPIFTTFNREVYSDSIQEIYLKNAIEIIGTTNLGEVYPAKAYNTSSLVSFSGTTEINNRTLTNHKNLSSAVVTRFGKGKICILSGMNFTDYDIENLDNKAWILETIDSLLL